MSVRARLSVVSVFPSCGAALVIITLLRLVLTCASWSVAASGRMLHGYGAHRPGDQARAGILSRGRFNCAVRLKCRASFRQFMCQSFR